MYIKINNGNIISAKSKGFSQCKFMYKKYTAQNNLALILIKICSKIHVKKSPLNLVS